MTVVWFRYGDPIYNMHCLSTAGSIFCSLVDGVFIDNWTFDKFKFEIPRQSNSFDFADD